MILADCRTGLIVPLADSRFVAKAHERGADAVILDLEDGVAPDRKDAARQALGAAVERLRSLATPVMVRINREPALLEPDLLAALEAGVDHLLLPKVETVAELDALVSL